MATNSRVSRSSGRRPGRRRGDHGATAVEFAFIVPVLCAVLFGIIDYGLYFNESLNVRHGVREAARQAVVQNVGSVTAQGMADNAVAEVGAVAGTAYGRVVVPGEWKRGESVIVCAMVPAESMVGFVPLPDDGLVKSKTSMSIEVETTAVAAGSAGDTGTPAGQDWSWCA